MFIIKFCTIEYCGSLAEPSVAESPYLKQIGTDLHPKVDILWTGVCVCVRVRVRVCTLLLFLIRSKSYFYGYIC